MKPTVLTPVPLLFLAGLVSACSSPATGGPLAPGTAGSASVGGAGAAASPVAGAGAGAGGNGTGGTLDIDVPPLGGTAGTASGGAPIMLTDLVKTEVGGYKRGDEIVQGGAAPPPLDGNDGCGVIVGVVRDFQTKGSERHPDFEVFAGTGATTGLVASELDANRKPVYSSQCEDPPEAALCPGGQQTTGQANFDQWYRDTPGVNRPHLLYFQLEPFNGILSFQSDNFVPVDGAGFDDSFEGLDGVFHNYGFTTELHLKFKYSGGESFTFTGDDDVWVFINGRLAIDLGGLHTTLTDTLALDDHAAALGLEKGNVYPLELFHAERHSNGSRFRIDSTLSLVDCGSIPVVK